MNEIEVKQQATTLEQQAQAYQIATNEDYEEAANFLKRVKGARKQVEDYWEEPIKKAFEAHRVLTAKRQQMIGVCDSAEKTMKSKMLHYQRQLDIQQSATVEEAKKVARTQTDELIEQAANAEQRGDSLTASMALAQADMISRVEPNVELSRPKVTGISTRTKTVVNIIDDNKVPAFVNGFCIRSIDQKSILALHKLNPSLEIPGIIFSEEKVLAVR